MSPINEWAIEAKDVLTSLEKARYQLGKYEQMLRQGLDRGNLVERIKMQEEWIRMLRNDLLQARNQALRGFAQTVAPGSPGATLTGEEMLAQRAANAAELYRQRAATEAARSAARTRFVFLSTGAAVTLIAVLAIVAVGLNASSRQSAVIDQARLSSSGPVPEERFIGPEPPAGTCTGDVAGQHGLLWTDEWGWRAPDASPEPLLYEYDDNAAGHADYLADYNEWENMLRTRVADALVEAADECGEPIAAGSTAQDPVKAGFTSGRILDPCPCEWAISYDYRVVGNDLTFTVSPGDSGEPASVIGYGELWHRNEFEAEQETPKAIVRRAFTAVTEFNLEGTWDGKNPGHVSGTATWRQPIDRINVEYNEPRGDNPLHNGIFRGPGPPGGTFTATYSPTTGEIRGDVIIDPWGVLGFEAIVVETP